MKPLSLRQRGAHSRPSRRHSSPSEPALTLVTPAEPSTPPRHELDNLNRLARLYCIRYLSRNGLKIDGGLQADATAVEQIDDEIAGAEKRAFDPTTRLASTLRHYDLSTEELRIVATLFAVSAFSETSAVVQSTLERFRRFHDGLTVGGVLGLVARDFDEQIACKRHFAIGGRLIERSLIILSDRLRSEDILTSEVHIRPRVVSRVLGDENIYDPSATAVRWAKSNQSFDSVVLPEEILLPIRRFLENYETFRSDTGRLAERGSMNYGLGATFLFHGESGTGKTMLAKAIANRLDRKLFTVTPGAVEACSNGIEEVIRQSFIEAHLQDGVLYFDEADDLFPADSPASRSLLIELENTRCVTIFSSNHIDRFDSALERRMLFKYEIPFPDTSAREEMWRRFLAEAEIRLDLAPDCADLARRYVMPGGYIKNATLYLVSQRSAHADRLLALAAGLHEAARYYYRRFQLGTTRQSLHIPVVTESDPTGSLSPEIERIEGFADFIKAAKLSTVDPNMRAWLGAYAALTVRIDAPTAESGIEAARAVASKLGSPHVIMRSQNVALLKRRGEDAEHAALLDRIASNVIRAGAVPILLLDCDGAGHFESDFMAMWSAFGAECPARVVVAFDSWASNEAFSRLFPHDYRLALSTTAHRGGDFLFGLLEKRGARGARAAVAAIRDRDYPEAVYQKLCKGIAMLEPRSIEELAPEDIAEWADDLSREIDKRRPLFGG